MKHLPYEIFFNIFPFLHQEEKLECMLVCRSWRDAIQDSLMFKTVRIASMSRLEKLIRVIEKDRYRGEYVERVIIDTQAEESLLISDLLHLLPNLRVLILTEKINFPTFSFESYACSQRIKYISDVSKVPIAMYFLQSNLCPNLTTLSIGSFIHFSLDGLQNAPALKSLTLYDGFLNIFQLEVLQNMLPCLEILKLLNFRLMIKNVIMNFDLNSVQPATSIRTFNFTSAYHYVSRNEMEEEEIIFLTYIGKKYTNLTDFRYEVLSRDPNEYDEDTYKSFWNPVIQSLGSRLTTFSTGTIFQYADIFNLLDNANCRINKLRLDEVPEDIIITTMPQSKQINSIHTLILGGIDFSTFEWLKSLSTLKKLKITNAYDGGYTPSIDLNQLMESCPASLKILSFDYVNVTAEYNHTTHPNQIESLSFAQCYFYGDIDIFISKSFSHLRKLKFLFCCLHEKTLILSTLNLSHLKIYDAFGSTDKGVLIKTHCNNESRWYIAKDNLSQSELPRDINAFDVALYPAVKSCCADQVEGTPFVTVECNSLQNLFIHE